MSRTALRTAAISLSALAALAAFAPAASASGRDGVRAEGPCTMASDWKLTAKTDDGRIEVEYEVDSNVVGQTWQYRITDQGVIVAQGTATTTGPSGSFSIERKVTDRAGTDTFVGQARNRATGETCSGRVNL